MKWGILGGTFDPIHFGHLRPAQEILEGFGLDRVVFIPSSVPPFKADAPGLTPFHHRLRMLKLAIEDNHGFSVSDIESQWEGKSYSVMTVRNLKEMYGTRLELYFIMGTDAFDDIALWKDWEELLTSCNFVIMTRPGSTGEGLTPVPPEFAARLSHDTKTQSFKGPTGYSIHFRRITSLEISSTDIRTRIKNGLSIKYLTPEAVCEYIKINGLYR